MGQLHRPWLQLRYDIQELALLPIDAYNDTAARGRTFLLYHDGLMNVRTRSIRSDWKAAFQKLMHWPVGADIDRVDSKDVVLVLRDGASLTTDHFSAQHLDDLLRASLVFAVSALDRYVHERVIKGIVGSLKQSPLTKPQQELMIPVTTAITISEEVRMARKAGTTIRTANIIRKKVQELLHKRPFQSFREIEYAFNLLGVTNISGQLQILYGKRDITAEKAQLNRIVSRRNAIVHEGDLLKHERGGKVRMQPIARKYVEDSLNFIGAFVGHLEHVS